MACACGRSGRVYVWTSADGKRQATFAKESAAKAKTIRAGGSYISRAP